MTERAKPPSTQREAIAVSSNDTRVALSKHNGMRQRFLTAELSDEEVEQIASARMASRHDYLDQLLYPQ